MATSTIDLVSLLDDVASSAQSTINTVPRVDEVDGDFDAADIPSAAAQRWVKIPDVVVVVCDLKGSTALGTGGKHDTTTARIYKSAVDGAVRILHEFGANYIDIQGDGGFGVFWGDNRYERAFCAGVTIRTFSDAWFAALRAKDATVPHTGYKVGIASERVLVKRLGTRNDLEEQEPVWAGKPVNFASKCAQAADVAELIVTDKVWDRLSSNDYVAFSCDCHGAPAELWEAVEVEVLPEDSRGAVRLTSAWCDTCGPSFCDAIMTGARKRASVTEAKRQEHDRNFRAALLAIRKRDAEHRYPKW
ncbi:hypothetical protein [Demequina phytophila]|uniref:hypothetical protein n=1 Tax=Demequina phytophila TaxID=1638981 RepID=UPI00078581DF|nr:hypothetical protein [Demequina phytophila]